MIRMHPIYTKYIVNEAGIYADKVHNMVAEPAYTIKPKKDNIL